MHKTFSVLYTVIAIISFVGCIPLLIGTKYDVSIFAPIVLIGSAILAFIHRRIYQKNKQNGAISSFVSFSIVSWLVVAWIAVFVVFFDGLSSVGAILPMMLAVLLWIISIIVGLIGLVAKDQPSTQIPPQFPNRTV